MVARLRVNERAEDEETLSLVAVQMSRPRIISTSIEPVDVLE